MTEEFDKEKLRKLGWFLKGNVDAFRLAVDLLYIAHFADDIFDADVERSKEDIKEGFRKLLVGVPQNPFYIRFYPALSTLIAEAYAMWADSTAFEQGDEEERFICFQIRNSTLMILHHMMFLVGGESWLDEQGSNFWRTFAPKIEKWEELRTE